MTSTLDRPDTPAAHGPAEVRAAIVACSNDLGIASFDRNMDEAYRRGEEAFRAFLDRWWAVSQVAAGRGAPEDFGLHPVSSEDVLAEWHRRHPGEKLDAA